MRTSHQVQEVVPVESVFGNEIETLQPHNGLSSDEQLARVDQQR